MKNKAKYLLTSPWALHSACCAIALLGCTFILWPLQAEKELQEISETYAGTAILGSFIASALLALASTAYFFLHMRNLRAIGQTVAWGGQWGAAAMVFAFLAIKADVDPPSEPSAAQPIQVTDTLHEPNDRLTAPSSLTIHVEPGIDSGDKVVETPNLSKLGGQYPELLSEYLGRAPRWAFAGQDDTFYTQPGHVVLEPPSTGGLPGHVHASFRYLTSGAQLPAGYAVIKPGGDFPKTEKEKDGPPDLALEIDAHHFLLLAWRGSKQAATAHKAINAAIAAVDARMQELAENPNEDTIAQMVNGKSATTGKLPELRVSEPPSQYGIYQAEAYANPGRAGSLVLSIKDLETQQELRRFSFPARHSGNGNELFRYDIPGPYAPATDEKERHLQDLFPPGAPFFAIKEGAAHEYFGVAFELLFLPEGSAEPEKLLRRCYKVQAYEKPLPPQEKENAGAEPSAPEAAGKG